MPELARRLGNKNYTTSLRLSQENLEEFIAEPMEYLTETIGELNDAQRAALTLVFLHRSRLPKDSQDHEIWSRVSDKFGVSQSDIMGSLEQIKDTFVVIKTEASNEYWSFSHPTISDALSSILGKRLDLVELYLRGVRIETILSDVTCEKAKKIRDSVVVPDSLNDLLVERLLETPDEPHINNKLFSFLHSRASDSVFRAFLEQISSVLYRDVGFVWRLNSNVKLKVIAKANKEGLLPSDLKEKTSQYIESKITNDLDCSILDDDDVLAIMPATKHFSLLINLRHEIQENISNRIDSISEKADLDTEPEDSFYELEMFLSDMESIMQEDDEIKEKITDLQNEMEQAIEELRDRINALEEEWIGEDIAPVRITEEPLGARSLFSDVDE